MKDSVVNVDMSGRRAVVTGGCSGIGLTAAQAMLAAGARVVIADINGQGEDVVRSELEHYDKGRAAFVQCDVSDSELVKAACATAVEALGGIDILVNSAGISAGLGAPMESIPAELWKRVIDVNLSGTFYWCQEAGKDMMRHGGGAIVNVASISGSRLNRGLSFLGPYNVSKAGVIMLTQALAESWVSHGIRVNCISPGYTATPLIAGPMKDPKAMATMEGETPMGRLGRPEEIAAGILYLASDAASYITGHDLVVDGGYTLW